MERVKVYKDGRAYLGRKVGREFAGSQQILRNALTFTISRESNPEKIAHSLRLTLQDMYLQQGKRVRVLIVPEE